MAATFSNPRWDALPCERMRGCSFADDFLTLERIAQNDGVDSGSGNSADFGLTTTGAGWIVYDKVTQPSGFSVHVRFKSNGIPSSVIVDGDMEAAGVTAWTAASGATLTKETTNPYEGTQCLRVSGAATTASARQYILTSYKPYRIRGWARSDGTAIPNVDAPGVAIWTGTNSTDWQEFDEIGIGIPGTYVYFEKGTAGTYVEFDAITVTPLETIIYNEYNFFAGLAGSGFAIWFDTDGIKANHSGSTILPTQCEVAITDMRLGDIFDVTYVVDMTGGTHSLYVNALAVNTQTTTVNTEIGVDHEINVGWGLSGTIYKARIFDAVLTEAEHDVYHAGTLESLMVRPWASYRCNSFNNDTDGHYVWDRTTEMRDLEKADRATASKFPTLATIPTPHYVFDGVDDYLTNPNTLPSAYTITAAKSAAGYAGGTAYPVIQQDNDTTFLADLITEGGYSGLLHSLVIHNKALTQLELYADEYAHMYWLWRGRAYGAIQRLIVEDVCKFALFLDYPAYPFTDFAGDVVGTVSGTIGGGGASGVWFQEPTGSELLADGDMELAGTADWGQQNGATLTKDVTNPQEGIRCLRITRAGDYGVGKSVANMLTIGDTYRIKGWARGDGTSYPQVWCGSYFWTGTVSTTWQYFDFAFVAGNDDIFFFKTGSAGTWVEIDDVSIFKVLNDGYLTYPDSADLECDECTILVHGDFAASVRAGTIVDKGTNYRLRTNGNQIDFNGSTISHTFANNTSIAVTAKPGEKPRFSVDGVYIGEGTTTVTPDSTDTTELTIGSNNEHDEATQYRIKQVHIFNKALTDV